MRILWILITSILLLVFFLVGAPARRAPVPAVVAPTMSYGAFWEALQAEQVSGVELAGAEMTVRFTDAAKSPVKVRLAADDGLLPALRHHGIDIVVAEPPQRGRGFDLLISFGPVLLFVFLLIFLLRRPMGGSAMAKSGARRFAPASGEPVTFAAVAGIDEARNELSEVVDFLRNPAAYARMGARIPKGILLVGQPGTGKTLLARAIAGEAGVPFFSISGSGFVEMYVGVGAARVRSLFAEAKRRAPCLIFIDEIDAVGRKRGSGTGGSHDEREQTLNQLLVELDGFESNSGIILIGATNRVDILDPALLRPGRFDRRVHVPHPDVRGREQILGVVSRTVPLAEDVSLSDLARATSGLAGADLANLVNEAALLATRDKQPQVTQTHLLAAKDKVVMGVERRSLVMSEEDRRRTAIHEAGHALATLLSPSATPLRKVTIVPRGDALGLTVCEPEEDRLHETAGALRAHLVVLLAGRSAELALFGEPSAGAASDLARATDLARRMAAVWGMGLIGPFAPGDGGGWSEKTRRDLDEAVRSELQQAEVQADIFCSKHRGALVDVAEALMERETLDEAEVRALLAESA